MRYVMATLIIGLIAGCGPTYWHNNNPGASWNADLYECTRLHSTTITSGGGTGLIGSLSAAEVGSVRTDDTMRDLCLKSRGWYQVSQPSNPAPEASPVRSAPSKPSSKDIPLCPWGEYWKSATGQCTKIGQ